MENKKFDEKISIIQAEEHIQFLKDTGALPQEFEITEVAEEFILGQAPYVVAYTWHRHTGQCFLLQHERGEGITFNEETEKYEVSAHYILMESCDSPRLDIPT